MKRTILWLSLAALPCLGLAQVDYYDYCGQINGGYEYGVHIGEGVAVLPLQDQRLQLNTTSAYQPTDALAHAKAKMRFNRDECAEYGLINGDITARVYFEFDQSALTRNSTNILNRVGEQEKKTEAKLHITGHADHIGSDEYNIALGTRRAIAVNNYLFIRGIDQQRMTIDSKGKSEPIASNDTAQGRALNRRVDIKKN